MTLQLLFTSPALSPQSIAFSASERVYDSKDPAQYVYYIRSGEVRTFQVSDDGSDRLIEILGPGDWFNVAAFSSEKFCGSRATCATPSVIVRVPADKLLAELTHNWTAAGVLLKQFADRLQKARSDAAHLVFDDCNTRLIHTLLQLSQTVAATPRADGVELRITHLQARPGRRRRPRNRQPRAHRPAQAEPAPHGSQQALLRPAGPTRSTTGLQSTVGRCSG